MDLPLGLRRASETPCFLKTEQILEGCAGEIALPYRLVKNARVDLARFDQSHDIPNAPLEDLRHVLAGAPHPFSGLRE